MRLHPLISCQTAERQDRQKFKLGQRQAGIFSDFADVGTRSLWLRVIFTCSSAVHCSDRHYRFYLHDYCEATRIIIGDIRVAAVVDFLRVLRATQNEN
jgi:hypothetical protein